MSFISLPGVDISTSDTDGNRSVASRNNSSEANCPSNYSAGEVLSHDSKLSSNHSTSVLSHVCSMYGDVDTSDVVVVVGGTPHHVHRIILAQSPVFKTMLYGTSWQESTAKRVMLNEIEQYAGNFGDLIKYLYGLELQIGWQNVEALVYYGDKYAVDALLSECLDFFYHQVEVSGDLLSALNGWKTIRRILSQRQNTDCLNVLKSMLFSNVELIMKNDSIIEAMDEEDVTTLLSSDQIVCRTEFSLFKFLERWIGLKTTANNRISTLLRFVPLLRMPYMHVQEISYTENSPKRLFSDARSDDFKMATSTIKSLLCDAYKFHVIRKAERDNMMSLPAMRFYLDGSACMQYRLLNTDGLSSWSKMDSYFKVRSSMSSADVSSTEWGFCVTLMRKINVRRQQSPSSERQRINLLSLEVSQNFCGPVPFSCGIIYLHEKRGDSVLRRRLTRFDFSSTRMKTDIPLENVTFDEVIVKNSPYHYVDEGGNLVFLALDIFLLE